METVEPDLGSDGDFLSDKVFLTGNRKFLNFLVMSGGKIIIMQSKRRILFIPIVPVKNLAIVTPTAIIKIKLTISRVLDQVKSFLLTQTKQDNGTKNKQDKVKSPIKLHSIRTRKESRNNITL